MIQRFLSTAKQTARRFRNRFLHTPLILLYHRVADLPSDPQLLCVTPAHFAEHLRILRRCARPMSLQEMVRGLRDSNLPRKAVAVTFDDGYADNLHNAKPILEQYGVPATVYVSSGFVGNNREFAHDMLEGLFLQPGKLPAQLALVIAGRSHYWDLGDDAYYSEAAYRANRAWHVEKPEIPTTRHRAYRSLCKLLYALPDSDRRLTLDALTLWAGNRPICRASHRVLESDEIRTLAKGGLVEIGSHTVTHPVLSALHVAGQREEVERSKTSLEEILGQPVNSFAYPYGTRSDYTAETTTIVREAGYDNACSNFEGLVEQGTDPWQLPRFLVRDWDGEEFARRLNNWRGM